jgi:hypothetical protein
MIITSTKSQIAFVKAIVYGEAGVGKTVLLSTAPAPLILSIEQGLLSLADKDVPVVQIPLLNPLKALNEAFKFLQTDKLYETVGIDSLSELGEALLGGYKEGEKDPRVAYGKMAEDLYKTVKQFRSLTKHVIFVTKQVYDKDEVTGKTSYRPMTPGKAFTTQIPYLVDEVFCMRIGQKDARFIQTQPDFQYSAKDRSGKLLKNEEPDLTKIINKILNRSSYATNTDNFIEPLQDHQ